MVRNPMNAPDLLRVRWLTPKVSIPKAFGVASAVQPRSRHLHHGGLNLIAFAVQVDAQLCDLPVWTEPVVIHDCRYGARACRYANRNYKPIAAILRTPSLQSRFKLFVGQRSHAYLAHFKCGCSSR